MSGNSRHVRDEILDDVHCVGDQIGPVSNQKKLTVRQRVNFDVLAAFPLDALQTSQGILTVDVHSARSTNAFAARPSQGQSGINLVLDLQESVQHHRTALREVDRVLLHVRLVSWLVGVPSVNRKGLQQRLLALGEALQL